jgi:UDP-N-acetylmuramoylalanine--D-glutamate ligase
MYKKQAENIKKTEAKEWLPEKTAILGAGRSGIAVAKFLLERGVSIFISETCGVKKMDFILASNSIADKPHEANGHTATVLEYDLIICSPGIPSNIHVLKKARKMGIPVWSEIELAYRQSKAPYIAITGSTGKSTTVCLVGSILKAAKTDHTVAGNIGLPLISVAPTIPEDGFVAAEISSFQLENIDLFKPRVVAILNLMKNHLDRYESETDYYNAKKEIVRNMSGSDTLVVNANDKHLVSWVKSLNGKVKIVYFGDDVTGHDCVWHSGGVVYARFNNKKENIINTNTLKIKGKHNIDNICAATALTYTAGVDKGAIAEGASVFNSLPHRLEFIREINGIQYYNDSKATTAESVQCAVTAFQNNVHLIAGGKDKGCDFTLVNDSIKQHVKSAALIGEAAGKISKEWKKLTDTTMTGSLEKALAVVNKNAESGDVVILSPGCSSFDMFTSFEERGDIFKKLVNNLTEKGKTVD